MGFDDHQYRVVRGRDCRRELAVHSAALAAAFGDIPPAAIETAMAAGLSGDLLREIARLNKTALSLAPVEPALREADPDFAAWIADYRLRTLQLNRRCLATTGEVHAALAAAGVPHAFFKGPLLQAQLHGTPFLRPSADCDVLVGPAAFGVACRALRRRGFRSGRGLGLWWSAFLGERHLSRDGGAAVVDLHRRLQQPGAPSPRRPAAFLRAAAPVAVGGAAFPVLSPAHAGLLLAMTVVKSFRQREPAAGYVADLRAALDRAGAEAGSLARLHGLEATLAFGRRAVDALFGPHTARRWGDRRAVLPDIGDQALALMLVAPWNAGLPWPRGRQLLWELCDQAPGRFGAEAAWMLASQTVLKGLGRLERL